MCPTYSQNNESVSDTHLPYKHIWMSGIYLTPSFIIQYNKRKSEEHEDQSSKKDNKYQRAMLTL